MKKSRFSEELILAILREQEPGLATAEACRRHGISSATLFKWKATRLTVWGDAGDTVSTLDTGWSSAGTTVIGENACSIFQKGQAQLIIHADIFIDGMQL